MALKKATGLPFVNRARQRADRERTLRLRRFENAYRPHIPARVENPEDSGPIYQCPLSMVPFSGQCPVRACPGNKPGFETGGCLFIFYGRTKLDRADIMFSYKINEKKLHDSISHGQDHVVNAVGFYRALNDLRSRDPLGYCPHCGVGHQKGVYRCENIPLCEDRKRFAETLLKTSHLAYTEIQATPRDVYLISRELAHLRRLAQAAHTNMSQLLGVDSNQLKALADATNVT